MLGGGAGSTLRQTPVCAGVYTHTYVYTAYIHMNTDLLEFHQAKNIHVVLGFTRSVDLSNVQSLHSCCL